MDLPTYTSIWRIEKRLYKLYDFRLPMPLPIGQLAVFVAVAVPYVVLLTVIGLPFNHTLIWLYVIPPGVTTWLFTRPVIEHKRLPELVRSQVRYLAEPKVWCRMAPHAERDIIMVTARVWRTSPSVGRPGTRSATVPAAQPARAVDGTSPPAPRSAVSVEARPAVAIRDMGVVAREQPVPRWTPGPPIAPRVAQRVNQSDAEPARSRAVAQVRSPAADPAPTTSPDRGRAADPVPASADAGSASRTDAQPAPQRERATSAARAPQRATVVRVGAQQAAPSVEVALAGPAARRGDLRVGRVALVPGGQSPGKPDQLQRDRARAQAPIEGPRRVVVLGCTVGAGQTVTALLTGDVLASLRSEQVAVLDLNPNDSSLAVRARVRPALSQAASLGPSRLIVLDGSATDQERVHEAEALEQASAQYPLVLADPSTASIPSLLTMADQLVLVAPASAAAPGAIGLTFEWLEAHEHAALAAMAIMVLNGVSRRSLPHVEQAERYCKGRCRAIVRVPWDDQIKSSGGNQARQPAPGATAQHWDGLLSPASIAAYTALAGVLVSALAKGSQSEVRQ